MKIKKNYTHDISSKSSSYIYIPFPHTQDVHCLQWTKKKLIRGGNTKYVGKNDKDKGEDFHEIYK